MLELYARESKGSSLHDTGRSLLSDVYHSRFSERLSAEHIAVSENGKPYLRGEKRFEFNISHSGSWAVLAVDDAPVGVDIQIIKAVSLNVAKRFYTAREYAYLLEDPEDKRTISLIRMWTVKEAVCKAKGNVLAAALKTTETISFDNTFKKKIGELNVATLLFPGEGYMLSVAAVNPVNESFRIKII